MNPSFAYVIPSGKEKLIKVIYEGNSYFREWDDHEGDNSIGIQAYTNIDGTAAGINFVGLVTHQYLWPGGRIGQTNNALRERCTPGVPFNFTLASSVQGDTACALYGSHFYRSLGNLGDINVFFGL